jgi:hypothetical protein
VSNQHTTDEIFSPIGPPTPEGPTTRFIDIHIYEQEPEREESPSIESKLEQEHTESARPYHKQRSSIIALCVGIMCLSVVITLVIVSLLPLLTPDATITIVPSTQQIRTTISITVTTGPATGTQIPGRELAAVMMSQAKTVPATGIAHQDAQLGHGMVTFYNSAPYEQTITAGTMLTGADSIQIITDQDAYLSPAQYPTFGQTTVPAHTVIIGLASNIRAGDIYGPCNCRLNVSAVNSTFTGGQQARDFQTVTQADIDAAASSLKSSLDQSVQAALKTQIADDQTLITPIPCHQSITPDHRAGNEATQVTITVSETCSGATYNTQAFQRLIAQHITQEASRQLGEGYIPTGVIQSSILQATPKDGSIILQVRSTASYAYQFTQEQQQKLEAMIAGKTQAQAITTLLHVPGLQSVSVSSATLPTDTKHIRVIVVYAG